MSTQRQNHANTPIITNINRCSHSSKYIRAFLFRGAAEEVKGFRSGREVLDGACRMLEYGCDWASALLESGGLGGGWRG